MNCLPNSIRSYMSFVPTLWKRVQFHSRGLFEFTSFAQKLSQMTAERLTRKMVQRLKTENDRGRYQIPT